METAPVDLSHSHGGTGAIPSFVALFHTSWVGRISVAGTILIELKIQLNWQMKTFQSHEQVNYSVLRMLIVLWTPTTIGISCTMSSGLPSAVGKGR